MNSRVPFLAFVLLGLGALAAILADLGCRAPGGPAPGLAGPPRPAPRPLSGPVRGVWVARYHYHYPDDVRAIIRNCAAIGCNTVYWQVRGEATVSYASTIEPWSREYNHRHPGFDPLAIAVEEAHKHGLRIEAYVNVMPGWKGQRQPPIRAQLYHRHPDWFMHAADGRRQPLGDFYVILNPCLPEVRRHIVSVVDEILARYDVDGIHLDYVRYAWDGSQDAKHMYPRDRRTLALYHRETGLRPDDDQRAWNHWRANQLTRLVAEIRSALDRRRPGASLTAAVWRDPYRGYAEYLQNSVAWLRSGLVDAVMPMAYTDKPEQFAAELERYRALTPGRRVVPGIGVYQHTKPEQLREQLRRCAAWGGDFALFSYESLCPTAGERQAKPGAADEKQGQRQMRRAVLEEFLYRR